MMGLEEGGRKRAAVMWYLVGLPSYKNLGEVLEGLLARHLASKRQKKIQETLEEHLPIEHATRALKRSRHQWSVCNRPIERNAWPAMSR
jgi:hypothetical protein